MSDDLSALLCNREASLPWQATTYGAYYDCLQLESVYVFERWNLSVCDPTYQTPIKDWFLLGHDVLAMAVWKEPI